MYNQNKRYSDGTYEYISNDRDLLVVTRLSDDAEGEIIEVGFDEGCDNEYIWNIYFPNEVVAVMGIFDDHGHLTYDQFIWCPILHQPE